MVWTWQDKKKNCQKNNRPNAAIVRSKSSKAKIVIIGEGIQLPLPAQVLARLPAEITHMLHNTTYIGLSGNGNICLTV